MEKDAKNYSLSKHELAVMNTLWSEGRPLSGSEIIELSEERTWKESTIHLLLNSLLKKGMIDVEGMVRTTKNYARTFAPVMTANEYLAAQVTQSKLFNKSLGVSFRGVISALINQTGNKDTLIQDLKEIIDDESSSKKD